MTDSTDWINVTARVPSTPLTVAFTVTVPGATGVKTPRFEMVASPVPLTTLQITSAWVAAPDGKKVETYCSVSPTSAMSDPKTDTDSTASVVGAAVVGTAVVGTVVVGAAVVGIVVVGAAVVGTAVVGAAVVGAAVVGAAVVGAAVVGAAVVGAAVVGAVVVGAAVVGAAVVAPVVIPSQATRKRPKDETNSTNKTAKKRLFIFPP